MKKKQTTEERINISITKIKEISLKNKIPFLSALEVIKAVSQNEKQELEILILKKQNNMFSKLDGFFNLGMGIIKGYLPSKQEDEFELNAVKKSRKK